MSEAERLLSYLSADRLSTYLAAADNHLIEALKLYAWNARVAGAFWEAMGHLEVPLRNALDAQLCARHKRLGRPGSWTDGAELTEFNYRLAKHLPAARKRVRDKGKRMRHGQIVAELPLGFWRYLLSRQHTNLWPDLANAFPHAPDRARHTIEDPVIRLHEFRNRLAHHEAIWALPLNDLYADSLKLLGYIDPGVCEWVAAATNVQQVLAQRPRGLDFPTS